VAILNQHSILRRMVYNSGPDKRPYGRWFVWFAVRYPWLVSFWRFGRDSFLFSSMSGESRALVLNQHLILRRMVYNSCPGHTYLWSMIRVIWRPVGLIGFFLGFFLFSSMFGELSEMIFNQHLILRRMVYNSCPGHTYGRWFVWFGVP
jgi:hypothetical protein